MKDLAPRKKGWGSVPKRYTLGYKETLPVIPPPCRGGGQVEKQDARCRGNGFGAPLAYQVSGPPVHICRYIFSCWGRYSTQYVWYGI